MLKKIIIASASLIAVAGAQAQSSTLTIGGTVNAPSCVVTLTGGGAIDYGTTPITVVKTYSKTSGGYAFPMKTVDYSLTCDVPIAAVLAFSDKYAGKAWTGTTMIADVRYGVVDNADQSIGVLALSNSAASMLVDNVAAVGALAAPVGTNTWLTTNGPTGAVSALTSTVPGYAVGFIKASGQTVPQPISNVTGTYSIGLRLNPTIVDSATSLVTFKAGATVTVQYL
jgi:hypothetical protein